MIIDFKHIQVRVENHFGMRQYYPANMLAETFVSEEGKRRGKNYISAKKIRELKEKGWTVEELPA